MDPRPAPLALLRALATSTRGATAVEYGLILAMIVLAMMAALVPMAGATTGLWNTIANQFQNAR
jgi:pilus assembly protein Flp/PilA